MTSVDDLISDKSGIWIRLLDSVAELVGSLRAPPCTKWSYN